MLLFHKLIIKSLAKLVLDCCSNFFIRGYLFIFRDPFSKKRKAARILLLSGKTGKVLRWMETPNGEESYFSPVVYTLSNGTEMVVFGTGGETHGGALYVIQLLHLYLGKMESARPIYVGQSKGTQIILSVIVLCDTLLYSSNIAFRSTLTLSSQAHYEKEHLKVITLKAPRLLLPNSRNYQVSLCRTGSMESCPC